MYTRLQIALWSVAAVLGLAYSDGDAAVKPTAVAQTKTGANANSHGQVLSELHQAKHLLDHANHTYNGHRAKADHEIHKAIHILHPEHHKKSTAASSTAAKTAAKSTTPTKAPHQKGTRESQQASDTHLRQAEKLVHAALLELKGHHGEKAHQASKHLHHAAHEIQLAIHAHHQHHAKNNLVPAKN
jgi:hypothetical protein